MKDEIRKKIKEKRNMLCRDEVMEKSIKGTDLIISSDIYKNAETIMLYMSFANETDTGVILQRALAEGKKVILPVTDTLNTDIIPCVVSESTSFETSGAYSIREPAERIVADEDEIDVVLVPGIAFDKKGARIGFGKGYYDRFLLRTKAVKIGFCYDFQLLDSIPSDKHDVPMDYIVTNNGIYKVNPKMN